LTHEDIPVIDGLWEKGATPKSIMTITRSIDADYRLGIGAGLGIVDDESNTSDLVACILRYESGPLGILYVSEEHRGKGYGTALLREATRLVSEARTGNGLLRECSAFIKDGNIASERVFEKVGYVRENPNAKKRTGKRRANRKWIYPARHTEEDETSKSTKGTQMT
jgi:RimJ/RimL family protein N-acetyltransferase